MHVLIIPSWYKINTNPTLGSFFREQALALKKRGYKVTVAYPGFVSLKEFGKNKIGTYIIDDLGMITYRNDTYNLFYDKFYYNLKPYIIKKKLMNMYKRIELEQGRPDIIHVHSCFWGGISAVELGGEFNIPVVITEHSTAFSHNNISNFEKKILSEVLKKATTVIAVSESLKENMRKYCNREDILVINNIVDIDLFNINNIVKKNDVFVFLTVCYLMKKKGIDVLIQAFAKKFKNQSAILKIGGTGVEENYLRQLAKSLEIEAQIVFLGALSREEVAMEMNKCDVFVLPSRHETFGVVFIEALACGKPIIATKSGGPNDIVNDKNGILVAVDDIDSLAEAMRILKDTYHSYNSEEIRTDCIQRFSESVIIDKLNVIYNSLIKYRGVRLHGK